MGDTALPTAIPIPISLQRGELMFQGPVYILLKGNGPRTRNAGGMAWAPHECGQCDCSAHAALRSAAVTWGGGADSQDPPQSYGLEPPGGHVSSSHQRPPGLPVQFSKVLKHEEKGNFKWKPKNARVWFPLLSASSLNTASL